MKSVMRALMSRCGSEGIVFGEAHASFASWTIIVG